MPKFVMLEDLQAELQKCHSVKEITKFIKKHRKVQMLGDFLINSAEDRIEKSNYETGINILLAVYESDFLKDIGDDVTLYLRLGEYYIENGNVNKGKDFLICLCNETVDNYEDALEFRKLLPVWKKYKHLVQGCVQPSVSLEEDSQKAPAPEELLEELLEEVCSGGFDSYLSYHSRFFEETLQAAETLNKPHTAALLKKVADKFPDKRVPKNPEETETIIMDNSLDFEEEDSCFYDLAEKELS